MDKKLHRSNNLGFGATGILIALVILIILAGGGFFAYQYFQIKNLGGQGEKETVQGTSASRLPSQPSITEIDTSAWKTYRNEKYGFEVRYPSDWSIQDYKEGVIAPRFLDRDGDPIISSGPRLLARTTTTFEEAVNSNLGVDLMSVSSTKIIVREHLNNLESRLYTESDIQLSDGSIVREIRADFLRKVSDTHYDTIFFGLNNNDHRDVFKRVATTFKFIPLEKP